ncbi:structural protein [Roseomonas sp. JC162]|uniref:Structural protein n=1 Tax=Neoroseomonas marina TaxID=1232220 RepID=A0A848EEE2_9PROT|nr:structural protein [Neoroseomonas marina]NMJ41810.1 structural protein [Neoroseomonas marina]
MDPRQTRGYRNRNPGNIEHQPANRWQGLADPPIEPPPAGGGAPRFARFISHEYGIRALAMLLTTYQDRHGLRTIRGIVTRWAPGRENDTEAYIAAVARRMDRHPRAGLDLHSYADLRPLVEAVIQHELGGMPYDRATIDAGLRLAGVVPEGRTAVARSGTARAAAGTAAAGVGSVAAVEVIGQVAPHLGAAAELARALGPWLAGAMILGVAGWFVAQRMRRPA